MFLCKNHMKNLSLLSIGLFVVLAACNSGKVSHKVEFSVLGECDAVGEQYGLESNIAGDRYTFSQCLPEDFNENGYIVERKGDTLRVAFKESDKPRKAFKVVLDIETSPYSYIWIGAKGIAIGQSQP